MTAPLRLFLARLVLPTAALAMLAPVGCREAGPASVGVEGSTAPSGAAARIPSGPPQVDDANPYLGAVPSFPPAPAPERVALSPGTKALHRVPTRHKVAFITIDDGWVRRPEAIKLLRAARVPVSLFLLSTAAAQDPGYFRALQQAGAVIEPHTITHTSLRGQSYSFQRREICGSAARLRTMFGRRPTLFRPPYGNYDQTTLHAARDCGMRAVVHWTQTVDKGRVRFAENDRIEPGDIILMHFRPAFADDFLAALRAIRRSGLTPALLEDYLG